MNYKQSMEFISEISKRGSVLGLESMTCLLEYLGNPQDELWFVHIAGTNGKGSLLAYLSTVLQEAGYKTGRYLSPTVFTYCEKIQIDQKPISKTAIAKYLSVIQEVICKMEQAGKALPTVFEVETVAAFLYFRDRKCDIVVLETGMGGLTDATNVIKNTKLAVITPISMDHQGMLGEELAQIAMHKAGIIKEGSYCVSATQDEEVIEILKKQCSIVDAPLDIADYKQITRVKYSILSQRFSYKNFRELTITMAGAFQIENAALALDAINALKRMGYIIPDTAVFGGMKKTQWPGRFSVISKNPLFIVDGSHNEAGAIKLAQSLKLYFPDKNIIYIMGVFGDKEYSKIIQSTHELASHIITVATPDNIRALPAYDLAVEVKKYHSSVTAVDSLEEAVEISYLLSDKNTVIIAFGTLSFIGGITNIVKTIKDPRISL